MKKKKVQKPEKKVDILFTGLVRTPDMLKKSIYEMSELRKEGIVDNIIFSTWKGEIQKYPEVYEFFKKNRVKILENEEPEEAGLAHIFHQMKALDMGLKYINKNKFVLKIRSDMYIEKKFLKRLFLEKNKYAIMGVFQNGKLYVIPALLAFSHCEVLSLTSRISFQSLYFKNPFVSA